MRRLRDRLIDALEAIEAIEAAAAKGRGAFDADPYVRMWIVHHLQVIGEAVRPFSSELRELRPQIPWSQIVGIRHVLVHQYYRIDPDVVWAAVQNDLPDLKATVRALVDELGAGETGSS